MHSSMLPHLFICVCLLLKIINSNMLLIMEKNLYTATLARDHKHSSSSAFDVMTVLNPQAGGC